MPWGAILAIIFFADVFIPDGIPYLDEIVLGCVSLFLNVRDRSVFFSTVTVIGAVGEYLLKLP